MLYAFDTGIITVRDDVSMWDIYKFFSLPLTVGCEIRSPEFLFADSYFTLAIWPRGLKGLGTENSFGICLYKTGTKHNNGPVKFSMSISNRAIKTSTVECSEHGLYRNDRFMEWSEFLILKNKIAPNGNLRIICRMPGKESIDHDDVESTTSEEILDEYEYIPPLRDSCVASLPGGHASSSFLTVDPIYKFPQTIQSNFPYSYKLSVPSAVKEFCCSTASTTYDESLQTSSKSEIVNTKFDMTRAAHDNLSGKNQAEQISKNFSCFFLRRNRKLASITSEEELGDAETVRENETLDAFKDNSSQMTPESGFESSIVQNIDPRESKDTECDSVAVTGSPTFLCSSTLIIPRKVQSECKTAHEMNLVESQKAIEYQPNLHLTTPRNCLQDSNPGSVVDSEANVLSDSLPDSNSVQSEKPSASKAVNFKSLAKLSEHFETLYIKGKYHDLTIIMEEREFRVHKDILNARSPVFAELLSQKAGESNSDTIRIDPFDACNSEVFHDFLLYVYSGKLEHLLTENVCGLYCAANKYKLSELKEECIDFLKESLSIETISDVVRLTSKNEEYELQEMATFFFARNLEAIMVTDKWQQFMIEDVAHAVNFHLKALKIGYTKTIT